MGKATWHDQWSGVDATSDPGFFVRFLDETRASNLRMIEADPNGYYSFLEPRPGITVLDVGTGTGTLLHGLAKLGGPQGKVVGIDRSNTMIAEAIRRAQLDSPLEFQVGDAYDLQFSDSSFDRAMSHIVFQHLPQPERALKEMVRVVKPGGKVVLTEQDWDTLFFDCDDKALTRRIVHAFSDTVPNGQIGRGLPRMFAEAGLEQIAVQVIPYVLSGPPAHLLNDMVEGHLQFCESQGIVTQLEHKMWLEAYQARVNAGTMTLGFLLLRVSGTKPAE